MKDIDIVIPTFNRPDYLKRLLNYYKESGVNFRFIIADSSTPQNKKKNKKIIKNFSNLEIKYLDHFPPTLQQHYKFIEMVKYVKAPFCVFCADDDFIVPEAIIECVRFLKNNPDYSTAHGTYIGFYEFKLLGIFKQLWWKYRYHNESIESTKPLKRVSDHLENYTLLTWSVRRTDVVKKIYQEFAKTTIDPILFPEFGEMLPDLLTVIYGKVKKLNTFYAARQYFGSVSNYYLTLAQARKVGIYQENYEEFKKSLLKSLVQDGVTKELAEKTIDKAIEQYIANESQEYIINKVNKVFMKFPKSFLILLRIANAAYVFTKDKTDKIGNISTNSSKYYKSYTKIKESILAH
jgi:glycosyltransferase domain-containing protein